MLHLGEALVVFGEVQVRAFGLLGVLVEHGTYVVEETVHVFGGFALGGGGCVCLLDL